MNLLHRIVACIVISLLVISCKSSPSPKKLAEAASDYCACMRKLESSLSAEAKHLVNKAAEAKDPSQAMQEGIQSMDSATRTQVGQELLLLGSMKDKNSELGECLRKVDESNRYTFSLDDEEIVEKLIAELENKQGCQLTASIMKLGVKVSHKK